MEQRDAQQARAFGEKCRDSLICVDGYDNSLISGRVYNLFFHGSRSFANLMQLVLALEDMLEQLNYPEAFAQPRRGWDGAVRLPQLPPAKEMRGSLATFRLRLLFRQNASWQGCVHWLEPGCEQSFRSVLELLMLLDSALRSIGKDR